MNEEELIELIKKYPVLYDMSSSQYRDNTIRANAWEEISEKMHTNSNGELSLGDRREMEWREVISEAEQIVGYPTSFLNLRCLFNDEIANTAIILRKLVGTNHPLLRSAKSLLLGSKSNLQSVGLATLLVSKAAVHNQKEFGLDHCDSGVLKSQRVLAEVVEMKRTGHMIHKIMVNLQDKGGRKEREFKKLLDGNKIVLLAGDYLLATSHLKLSGLRNNYVTELICSGLRDLVEGDSIGDHDSENNLLPGRPKGTNEVQRNYDWKKEDILKTLGSNEFLGQGKEEWVLRTMLSSGSVLAKGCKCAMMLANLGKEKEDDAFALGGHLALLWQLHLDIKDFFIHPDSYSLVGAPVLAAMWEYPTLYSHVIEYKVDKTPIQYRQLYYDVRATRAMEYLARLLDEELAAILKYSDRFPVVDARNALQKMALTIYSEALDYMGK